MNHTEQGERLYKRTLYTVLALFFIGSVALRIGFDLAFPKQGGGMFGGLVGGTAIGWIAFARIYARRRCEKAGFADFGDQTKQTFDLRSAQPQTEAVEVRPQGAMASGLLFATFFFAGMIVSWWMLHGKSSDYSNAFVGILGIFVFGFSMVLSISSIYLPSARLNNQGVSAYHYGLFWRQVPWSKIAVCEIIFTGGNRGHVQIKWPVFKDSKGRVLLSFSPAWAIYGSVSKQREFWDILQNHLAEIKAKPTESNEISHA